MLAMWTSGMIQGPGPAPGWVDYVGLSIFQFAAVGVAVRVASRGYIDLRDDAIVVAHLRGETQVEWADVARCWADPWALRIETRSGDIVSSRWFAVPKWRSYGIRRPCTGENLAVHLMRLTAGAAPI
jgi:hypothetical protein